jgi:hypothetical protein
MSHNKILGAAIVTALSMGGGTAQAAPSFDITEPVTDTATVAMELFKCATTDETQALPSDSTFMTKYALGLGTEDANKVTQPFTVIYTLTDGVWDNPPLATQFSLEGAGSSPSISYQEVTDTLVKYGVNASDTNPVNGETKLVLEGFKALVKKTHFANSGNDVKLNIDITGGISASDTLTLAKSGQGIFVSFAPNSEEVKIDVGTAGKTFVGGSYAPNAANLGTMTIKYADPKLKEFDLTTNWDAKSSGDGVVTGGNLVIKPGPFDASTTNNGVFIDTNDSGCAAYEDGTDKKATVDANENKATFSSGITDLYPATLTTTPTAHKICVKVPGNAEINETAEAPKATLTANYTNRTGVSYPEGKLLHITKNGIICTIYLVTDGVTTSDNSNIRITNRSSRNGTLTATLTDQNGDPVFTNVELKSAIKPYETVYVNSADLVAKAQAAGHSGEFVRGNLTIGSDLPQMEVFGLLRNKGSAISPLLNMSLGASGNGCD